MQECSQIGFLIPKKEAPQQTFKKIFGSISWSHYNVKITETTYVVEVTQSYKPLDSHPSQPLDNLPSLPGPVQEGQQQPVQQFQLKINVVPGHMFPWPLPSSLKYLVILDSQLTWLLTPSSSKY